MRKTKIQHAITTALSGMSLAALALTAPLALAQEAETEAAEPKNLEKIIDFRFYGSGAGPHRGP